jgi:type VI secretion system protein ImpL
MFAALKRFVVVVIGFVLIALFIWIAGPLFAFGSYRPLESETSRLVAIGLVVAVWFGMRLVRRLRAFRASDLLVAAVLKQAHPAKDEPSAEVVRLRERFEEAVASLKQGRQDGHSLYDLPWYVIIGAPGSGKTTALLNSGLKFPLEQRVGRGGLRGVGGTRNCDWWFTDEAVLLDTAGRYTTQDSDATSDAEGWREFLALLAKYRKRRPLNGVILAVSASDLLTQGDAEREAHVEAARRRLNELNRELSVQLPVYVMVTKCDLVAGFSEYFDDLTQEQRAQVWGVTFPYEQTASGEAAAALPAEFEALMARLNERVFERLDDDRDVRRRTAIFGFPQQMAALRDVLSEFVQETFAASRLERPVLLRGVYFTSGTQEGTPIDRLLGSLGRRFGVSADAIVPSTSRGKAYFVSRVLKDVMIGESGLAGMNRTLEVRKAAAQLAVYSGLALVTVLAFLVWSWSAARNRAYLADVAEALRAVEAVPRVAQNASLSTLLPRLDAVRHVVDVADRHREDAPWGMRWGLYQGQSLGNAARDAYVRELDGALLPRVAMRIRERLVESSAEPEALYEYLKAYLMLGDPQRLDKEYLQEFADFEWRTADGASAGTGASLSRHFQALLAQDGAIRPVALDAALIAQARTTIRRASIPRIMYGRLKRRYADDTARAIRLDVAAGVGADAVLRRASGAPLATPIPALYSKPVFQEATTTATAALVAEYAADSWVWGEAGLLSADPTRLAAQVIDLYERDYVDQWDAVLADLDFVRFGSVSEMATALGTLGGASSPLRAVLLTVAEHTRLVEPPGAAPAPPAEPPGALASAGKAVTDRVAKLVTPLAKAAGITPLTPGAFVTARFQPLHQFVLGEPGAAPIDQLLARIGEVNKRLQQLGPEVGSQPAITGLSDPGLREALGALRQYGTNAPPVVRALVETVGEGATEVVVGDARGELEGRYLDNVVAECRSILTDRYPFAPAATREVPIADFGRLFGYKGVYERFFAAFLAPLVDTSQRPWRWRPGVEGSAAMLRQFEAARRIRDLFFPVDAERPAVNFTVTFSDMNPRATRFVLQVDGTAMDYVRGPSRSVPLRWPGGLATAVATFEDRGGPRQVESIQGPWAWFRLVDKTATQRPSDTGVVLEFQGSGHFVRVAVEADSVRNPVGVRDWQQFSCGS